MLNHLAVLLSVLAPLVVVPLTVITFYLKSLRDLHRGRHEELADRVRRQDRTLDELRRVISDFERDYTTKEEWLRECLHARHVLERLMVVTAGLDARRRSSTEPDDAGGGAGCVSASRERSAHTVCGCAKETN